MPFKAGNQHAKGHGRPKKETPKTIWLLQSLSQNGVDLESLLAKSLIKASHGDKQALDLAHLLAKFMPLVSNAPKQDVGQSLIETLVINKYSEPIPLSQPEPPAIETEIISDEGN